MSTEHREFDIRGQLHSDTLDSGHNIQWVSRKKLLYKLKSLNARGKYISFCSTNSCPFRDHL